MMVRRMLATKDGKTHEKKSRIYARPAHIFFLVGPHLPKIHIKRESPCSTLSFSLSFSSFLSTINQFFTWRAYFLIWITTLHHPVYHHLGSNQENVVTTWKVTVTMKKKTKLITSYIINNNCNKHQHALGHQHHLLSNHIINYIIHISSSYHTRSLQVMVATTWILLLISVDSHMVHCSVLFYSRQLHHHYQWSAAVALQPIIVLQVQILWCHHHHLPQCLM